MDIPKSGRVTRSQTKSEVRFVNDHTHPLSPGPSNTGSTSSSPTPPHKTLVVKIPYRFSGGAIENLDKKVCLTVFGLVSSKSAHQELHFCLKLIHTQFITLIITGNLDHSSIGYLRFLKSNSPCSASSHHTLLSSH